MTEEKIITALRAYTATDVEETAHQKRTIEFIDSVPVAFARQHEHGGHVGATAVVVNAARTHILLTRHTVTNAETFFGNHADGSTDLVKVARSRIAKDATERIASTSLTDGKILDVDIHSVPAHTRHNQPVPPHLHYDISFLFIASQDEPAGPTARWMASHEALLLNIADTQYQRILRKIKKSD